ncbi:ABC transporter ATP-binding protein [Nocardia callitridis]|uniref:ABC transporter ATP-binding protein n=1 Tax=Nocardia callitridis TaxID=648753 RepID=A0ABP9K6V1_9NOCA
MSDGDPQPRPSLVDTPAAALSRGTAPAPAIVFDRVGVTYGRGRHATVALAEFTLRVAVGETVALLGPSGSGKSTALKALAGFVRPRSGRVWLAGRDVTDLSPAKRGIGVVVQSYALFPHMKVRDNVAFGLKAHRAPRTEIAARTAEALAMVDMAAYAGRLPRELSGGQQQRVAIARALAIRPEVLLLDEPMAALDAQLRQSMLVQLRELRNTLPDMAVLYVTHDQTEALALADRIAVMRDARLVDVDTAQNLWQHPPSAFTAGFLGGANLLSCTVNRVSGGAALVTVGAATLRVEAPDRDHRAREANSPGLLCIRPHTVRIGAAAERNALRATVTSLVWRGASTRVRLAVDELGVEVTADLPGQVTRTVGDVVGVLFPDPAGVLVPPPISAETDAVASGSAKLGGRA